MPALREPHEKPWVETARLCGSIGVQRSETIHRRLQRFAGQDDTFIFKNMAVDSDSLRPELMERNNIWSAKCLHLFRSDEDIGNRCFSRKYPRCCFGKTRGGSAQLVAASIPLSGQSPNERTASEHSSKKNEKEFFHANGFSFRISAESPQQGRDFQEAASLQFVPSRARSSRCVGADERRSFPHHFTHGEAEVFHRCRFDFVVFIEHVYLRIADGGWLAEDVELATGEVHDPIL